MLKAILNHFEADKAVLKLANGQKLVIAKSELPLKASVGDQLNIIIKNNQQLMAEKQKPAKELLNEILKDSKES